MLTTQFTAPITTLAQDAWLHDLNPVLLPISGSIAIRWYGLAYVAGFIIAWLLITAMAKRKLIKIRTEFVSDFILAAVVGVLVGGRLGYAIVYAPYLFTDFTSSLPFWGLLNITKGGMASHGGMVDLLLASVWVARREKTHALHVLDTLALAGPPGILLGRFANFVNGELLGRVVAQPGEQAPGWSVRYPQELLNRPTPEQGSWLERVSTSLGQPTDSKAISDLAKEMIAGVQAGDPQVRALVEPMLHARHPSQFYQAFAEGVVVFIALWWVWRKPRRPGVVSAWFLIVYGIGRIATELVRLPDTGLGRTLGLSRGQWLSALMVLIGIGLLLFIRQRVAAERWPEPIGGWAHKKSDAAQGDAALEESEGEAD